MGVLRLFGVTLLVLFLALFLGGCATSTLFLKKDQYLYTSAKIKGNRKISDEALEGLQQQQPNRTILGSTPYLYFYQLGERLYDKKKIQAKIDRTKKKYDDRIAKVKDPKSAKAIRLRNLRDQKLDKLNTTLEEGNWLMRTVGEPPSIFDPNLMVQSAREMDNYLFNKGFFEGSVNARIDTMSRRRIRVIYTVSEGLPQKIRKMRYFAYNKDIQHILDSLARKGTKIREGRENYDQDKLVEERDRLDKAIRNSGYYAFSRDYIFVEADTSIVDSALGHRAIDVLFKVKDPLQKEHVKYTIAQVDFHISSQGGFYETDTNLIKYNGVNYFVPYKNLFTKVLDTKILVRPGQFYNLESINKSQAQLQSMDYFKFVNFNYDSLGPTDFRLRIQASRLPKYQVSDELGLLNSAGAIGPFFNAGIKVRNGLNRFDVLELSGRYSNEGQIVKSKYYSAREIGVNTTLTYPAIVFPFYTSYLFNRYNPKTRLLLGYTDLRRPEYSRAIFKATAGYTINLNPHEVIGLNVIDASLNGTRRLDPKYKNTLDTLFIEYGSPLKYSFQSAVVTSLSGFYVYNTSSQLEKKRGMYLRVFGEWGGEIPKAAAAGDTLNGLPNIKIGGVNLNVYRFARVQSDFRYYYPITKVSLLAFRLNSGVAIPRNSQRALPYEKYYFAGGPSSIRAWPPRRLSAGIQPEEDVRDAGFGQEQPGQVLIESSLELRQKLIGFVEGALFIDAGNVWSLPGSKTRPGGVFSTHFLRDIAVGTGAGLRFDFTFLVVRFDAGIKTYDPSRPEGQRWVIRKINFNNGDNYQHVVLNFGIGYPF